MDNINLDEFLKKIEANAKKSEDNAKKIEDNYKKIKQNTGAIEVLHTIKTYNNRFFTMWLITFVALILVSGYLIFTLKDIGTIEETTTISQDNQNGYNNYIGNDGDITNGKTDS